MVVLHVDVHQPFPVVVEEVGERCVSKQTKATWVRRRAFERFFPTSIHCTRRWTIQRTFLRLPTASFSSSSSACRSPSWARVHVLAHLSLLPSRPSPRTLPTLAFRAASCRHERAMDAETPRIVAMSSSTIPAGRVARLPIGPG